MTPNKRHGCLGDNVKVHWAGAENCEFAHVLNDAGAKYFLFTVLPFIADQFDIKFGRITLARHLSPWEELPKLGHHVIMVKYGFLGQLFATLAIILTGLCRPQNAVMEQAYQTLLGQNWVFVIGSLCAYYASQTWDVFIFHELRERHIRKNKNYHGERRWLWNNGSTLTSQIIDTFIYAFISFGLGLGWAWTAQGRTQLVGLMLGQYLLKAGLALLDTPFFYFFTRAEKAAPEKDGIRVSA